MEAVNKLFDALGEQLEPQEIDRFKGLLQNSPLTPGTLHRCTSFSEICRHLVNIGHIQPEEINGFEKLKKLFRQMGKENLVDMITTHEQEQGLAGGAGDGGTAAQGGVGAGGTAAQGGAGDGGTAAQGGVGDGRTIAQGGAGDGGTAAQGDFHVNQRGDAGGEANLTNLQAGRDLYVTQNITPQAPNEPAPPTEGQYEDDSAPPPHMYN